MNGVRMTLIEQLGSLVYPGAANLSETTRRKIIPCVKDWIAAYLVGLNAPEFKTVAAALAEDGSAGWIDVPPHRLGSSSEMAFRLGIVGHLANFNDAEFVGNTSPTSVLLPAILPLAASRNATMAQLVEAMAVGYGVAHLLGRVMNPDHFEGGWNATSTIGCVAATAGAARCLGLPARKACAAIAIAAGQMSGLKSGNGSIAKPFSAGRAASAAVWSALLAAHDAPTGLDVFSGPTGILSMFGGRGAEAPPLADIEHGVDAVVFKEFPCFFGAQKPVALGRDLSGDIGAEAITQVKIVTSAYTYKGMSKRAPATWAEGQFSCAHCVAVALIDGARAAIGLSEASLHRPDVRHLERLTVIEPDGTFEKFQAQVWVSLDDGRHLEARGALDLIAQGAPALADAKLSIVLDEYASEGERDEISSLLVARDASASSLTARLLALRPAIRR